MTRIRNAVHVFACMVLMLAAGVAIAQPARPTEGKNLATGKLCTFDPQPNYPGCKDKGDAGDLTDGLYNGCVPSEKGTVGWNVGTGWDVETMPVVLVDIDLGDARPIGKVTFDSGTGFPGVKFPLAVRVFVSADAEQYDLLCNILTESVPQDKPLTRRFVADDLKGWGRYVRLALLPDAPLMFFDEIEIIEGAHTREQARHVNKRPIPAEKLKIYAKQMRRGTPDLWSYSGYGSDRGEMHESGGYYGEGTLGHNPEVKAEHPEFYRASMDINALLIQKSFLDEKLRSVKRVKYYEGNIAAGNSQAKDVSRGVEDLQNKSDIINTDFSSVP